VVGSCEHGDEPSATSATELVADLSITVNYKDYLESEGNENLLI
jgi:hypothetical protein